MIQSVYDEAEAKWKTRVRSADGKEETLVSNVVITAVGQLNRPRLPDIKGLETFEGKSFHSAQWDHDRSQGQARRGDRHGRQRLPVRAGNRAGRAAALRLPAHGALDLADAATITCRCRKERSGCSSTCPSTPNGIASGSFWMLTDGIYAFVQADPNWTTRKDSVSAANDQLREMVTQYIKGQLEGHPELAEIAVPNYPLGGKRGVLDNGVWLGALKRPNVETDHRRDRRDHADGHRHQGRRGRSMSTSSSTAPASPRASSSRR